jgi:predicted DNA-binding transcriptional regulator AlpA
MQQIRSEVMASRHRAFAGGVCPKFVCLAGSNDRTGPNGGNGGGMYDKEFLNSWKEVAQYVGRSERTIQRWEREFGFPVHRPAGKLRSSVIAVAAEIDEWIRKSPALRSQLQNCPAEITGEAPLASRSPLRP